MGWLGRLFGSLRDFDVEPFRELACSSCGHAFKVGDTAGLITDEQVLDSLKEAGVAMHGADGPRQPDLVQDVEFDDHLQGQAEDALLIVAGTLSRGEKRLWACGECKEVNTYPGYESHLDDGPPPETTYTFVAQDTVDPESQFEMGIRYMSGLGVPEDPRSANEWFKKAAEQGHPKAQFHLATNYHGGVGVAQDKSEAFAWYLKAAEQGIARAQCTVAIFLNEGRVVPHDKDQAIHWLKKSAEQDDGSALFNLGVMYYNGDGLAQSDYEARRLFKRSAKVGYEKAAEVLRQLG